MDSRHHWMAEFSGQVQMFAAQVFPLCDKSGLNLTCEFNEDNVTGRCWRACTGSIVHVLMSLLLRVLVPAVFEEDAAEEGLDAFLQEEEPGPSSPGSEPSPKKKKKKKKKKKGEARMLPVAEPLTHLCMFTVENGDGKSAAYIDYPLYRSFWALQEHFANPHRILEKGRCRAGVRA